MDDQIHLGFEVGTGRAIAVPLRHLAVTGQTQESGKTTTLEALISRAEGMAAITFVTKRAELHFEGNPLAPYFRERADWQFVASLLEATLREKLKFERAWIMRASKGAKSLRDVQRNVQAALRSPQKLRGPSESVYTTLDEYLRIVIPQIERLPYQSEMKLEGGLNVMDLSDYSLEMQSLVIRSVLEWIYQHAYNTITVIPEAWEFVPQSRGSPVLLAAEQLIRKGGASRNYVWLDSQDIAGVHKSILRSVGVWILGVQREANEIERTLKHIPAGVGRPKVAEIMQLERGQFYACHGPEVIKVYVQPAWLDYKRAVAVAAGLAELPRRPRASEEEEPMNMSHLTKQIEQLTAENERLAAENLTLRRGLAEFERRNKMPDPAEKLPDREQLDQIEYEDDLFARFLERLQREAPMLQVNSDRPEIDIKINRRRIEADDSTLYGRVALLIAEGFFNSGATGSAAYTELRRRNFPTAKPNVYKACDQLATQGFLTKDKEGYTVVASMKVNIVEAA